MPVQGMDPFVVQKVIAVLMGSSFAQMFKRRPFKMAFFLYWLPARRLQQYNFNFRLKLLKSYGYTPSQLLDAGITATKLKNSKVFQVPDFRNDGVPWEAFQSAFSISQLLYHGCRIHALLAFPSRMDHLIEEGGKRLQSQDLPQEEKEEWTKAFINFKKSTSVGKLCAHCPVESWNDIFSISELLQAGKRLDAFWHVYPFECAEAWGFSVQDAVATAAKCRCVYRKLKEAGKSAQEVLHAINNLEEELREVESEVFCIDSAYTLSEKLHAGMAIQVLGDGPDAEQFKDAGCTGCQLKEAGFDAKSMARAGYSCDELRRAGFTLLEVKDAVSTTKAMAEAGFTAHEFKQHGITVKLLREDGCTADQLRIIGFIASELLGEYTALQLASAGYAALELQKLGCEASSLKSSFSAEEIIDAGFSPESLKAAGITSVRLQAHFDVQRLKQANFTAKELKESGFKRQQLEEHYDTRKLKDAGFYVAPKNWSPSHGLLAHPNTRLDMTLARGTKKKSCKSRT
eukprot:s126_g26.t1